MTTTTQPAELPALPDPDFPGDRVIEAPLYSADQMRDYARAALAASAAKEVQDVLAAFDAAIAAELPRVSHVEYDSHEICKHFATEVRKRIAAAAPTPAAQAQVQAPAEGDCATELRVIGDALLAAHDHLEMHKLERSHCNSAAAIRDGLATYSAWKKRADLAALPNVQPKGMAPTVEQAAEMGRTGAHPTEAERLLFEAWMRGHCWKIGGEWNGKQYVDPAESDGFPRPQAMLTRQLFAAWRDRAALAIQAPAPGDVEALRLADAIDPFTRKAAPDHLTSKVAADALRRLAAQAPAVAHAPAWTFEGTPEDVRSDTFPSNTLCATCGSLWGSHIGALCPAEDGRTFQPARTSHVSVQGNGNG